MSSRFFVFLRARSGLIFMHVQRGVVIFFRVTDQCNADFKTESFKTYGIHMHNQYNADLTDSDSDSNPRLRLRLRKLHNIS